LKRKDATQRLEELLANVAAGGRHARMVDEIWLFGSYARGSLTPGDVDLEIVITPDEKYRHDEIRAFSGYRHPGYDFLYELRGKRRGYEIGINRSSEIDFPEKTLLFQRGDDLQQALDRLRAIPENPEAGRAERDPVVPQLEGLDKELTRSERAELSALSSSEWIKLERLMLEEETSTPEAEEALHRLYAEGSPLGRAAAAVLSEMGQRGIPAATVRVGGNDLGNRWSWRKVRPDPSQLVESAYAVGWLRAVDDGVAFLAYGGKEYWHVLKPRKKGPIPVLVLRVGEGVPESGLKDFHMHSPGERHKILPELSRWVQGSNS
jgi:Nucleotidyltransferase domain